jgi:membrane protein
VNSNIKIIGRGDLAMGVFGIIKESVQAFIDDEALTRGAAIAFYTITSIGPVLFIVVAIAGLAFGEDAARGAISGQLSGLMGQQSADSLQTAIRSAASNSAGFLAAATGIVTLRDHRIGRIQRNAAISQRHLADDAARHDRSTRDTRPCRLLLVSLVVSALVTALSEYIDTYLPFGHLVLRFRTSGNRNPSLILIRCRDH